jgi:hypothetical protein
MGSGMFTGAKAIDLRHRDIVMLLLGDCEHHNHQNKPSFPAVTGVSVEG